MSGLVAMSDNAFTGILVFAIIICWTLFIILYVFFGGKK